jgi:hypothetical protein
MNLDGGRAGGVVEAHAEEERGVNMNLDCGHTVEVHMEEEQGADVEVHVEDAEEGAPLSCTRRRCGHRRVCGGKMTGLGFRGSGRLKKKNSSDGRVDYISTSVAKEE